MQSLLERLGDSPVALLTELVAQIRPSHRGDGEAATQAIHALCHLLSHDEHLRAGLRTGLMSLLGEREQVSLYAAAGMLPNTGFFSEATRRISHKLLPETIDTTRLKDLLNLFFEHPSDEVWVNLVADECWIDLLKALRFDEEKSIVGIPFAILQVLKSIRILSYHISAIGLEPELIRLEPDMEEFESPFLAQNPETLSYLKHFENGWIDPDEACENDKQLLVLLDQCDTVIQRIHHRATLDGTSIRLTFLLNRLQQHLQRMTTLLGLLDTLREDRRGQSSYGAMVTLFKSLVRDQCRKNGLFYHWRQSMRLLALRVTENASRSGEHYITETRPEYFAMWRSALGAGFIVAFMAMSKLFIIRQGMPPLTDAFLVCLNYGLGFILIHILHFTLATKQPAMTAAALAASIGEGSGKQRDLENLTTLIARTARTQIAAILGNVLLAIPVSILLGIGVSRLTGTAFINPVEAGHMITGINPVQSGAIAYAAITGVCLFLAGLIAGYYDNLGAYNDIPGRLVQLKWLRRILGQARQKRFAGYVENNLGAIAGNFYFGCMLGGVSAIGVLFGLPLHIRHITFSSAYFGYALVATNFHMTWTTVAWSIAGIAAIGFTNLTVSFALALTIALRARQVSYLQGKMLFSSMLRRLVHHPREFFLPPPRTRL